MGRVRLERTPVWARRGLFGSNGARALALCRTMVHEAGWDRGGGARAEVVMVRRTGVASADSRADSRGYDDDTPAWPGTGRQEPPAKAPWSGSGGRWTIWPMRIVLWAAILIVLYRGVMAIALNETPPSSSGNAAAGAQFPATLAEAYAMQFGLVYFNFSPATAAQRQGQLGEFLPPSVLNTQSQQFGFTGSATTQLQSEDVAGIDVRGAQSAVVTLLTTINGRLMEFGVPVYAAGGGIMAHPGGVTAGVASLRQAWDAAVAGIPAAEHAKTHRELREALGQYGA